MNTKLEFVDRRKMIVPSLTLVIGTDVEEVENKFEDSFNNFWGRLHDAEQRGTEQ